MQKRYHHDEAFVCLSKVLNTVIKEADAMPSVDVSNSAGSWSYTWHHSEMCFRGASSTPCVTSVARQTPARLPPLHFIRSQTIVFTPPFKLLFEIGTPVQQKVELLKRTPEGLTLGK